MSTNLDIKKLTGIVALFLHAAKIDDNYTDKEEQLIISFLQLFTKEDSIISDILTKAKDLEENSNQILAYTNLLKKNSLQSKTIIIKELWKIVLSDKNSDEYENNLMRRICGLIYFPDKMCAEIKLKLLNNR